MKQFARLFREIDETTKTSAKVDAMVSYFSDAMPADAAWAVWFLSGNRLRRLLPVRRLSTWAMTEADVREWLFEECYQAVGDLAETISLLLPDGTGDDARPLHEWVQSRLLPVATLPEERQREVVLSAWRSLRGVERFVWNKLITGGFRVGVSKQLVMRALSKVSGVDEGTIAHRMSGSWTPTADNYQMLVAADTSDADRSRPYPFFLAYPLEQELEDLGSSAEWQLEWKWDGIRAQLVRRDGRTYLWSRGEELVTRRFPELAEAATHLPDGTVLDGEVMPWKAGHPLSFAQLQRRIGRVNPGPKILGDVPVVMIVYDVLEHDGRDVRALPLSQRRELLLTLLRTAEQSDELPLNAATPRLIPSPVINVATWTDAREAQGRSRAERAEGVMLKRLDGVYGVGRRKSGWWKWKVQPYSLDAVMIYAQAGHGRRASLHTDYTFALWDEGALVPFAKAYSGLTDAEVRQLDTWIRRNTLEKFGPVRRVEPEHVFEIGFEAIQTSPRHKAGVAVRFPRILRWRSDKKPADADTLDALRKLAGQG